MGYRRIVLLAPLILLLVAGCSHGTGAPEVTTHPVSSPGSTLPVGEPVATGTLPAASPIPTGSPAVQPTVVATGTPTVATPSSSASVQPRSDVVPVITFAAVRGSSIEVDGYVPGILEVGGRCMATLVTAGGTVTASAPAEADATTVWCSNLTLAAPAGRASGWTVTLQYTSARHDGVSQKTAVGAS